MKVTATALLLSASGLVFADESVTVSAALAPPPWAASNACSFSVSAIFQDIGLFVVPLTPQAGANSSTGIACPGFNVSGLLVAVDDTNFDTVSGQNTTALVSCNSPVVATVTSPSDVVASLMSVQPHLRAIVLYPQGSMNWCDLQSNSNGPLSYMSIYTLNNSAKAALILQALGSQNQNHQPTIGSITAVNATSADSKKDQAGGGTSPAAMSALYAVTGIITLLFLIIIVTGTIRAHRNPERYGPRAAFGGRVAQSRAKGLARAVLDTIPIVKFSDNRDPKPESAIELENGTESATAPTVDAVQDADASRTDGAAQNDTSKEDSKGTTSKTVTTTEATDASAANAVSTQADEDKPADVDPDNLGCSICTEDFRTGEDVRVLPCQHQFHPSCIDPWLTNVSGTCPLCRLDLRPEEQQRADQDGENGESLPPPLTEDGQPISFRTLRPMTMLAISPPVPRRQEVMLASIRARQASIDAAAAAAAAADANPSQETDTEGGASRTGLSARLRERFHIRTRTQAAREPGR